MVLSAAAIIFPMAACSPAGTQDGSSAPAGSVAASSGESSFSGKAVEAVSEEPSGEKGISAQKEKGEVEITVPAVLFSGNAASKLTDEQKKNSLPAAKINEDGSVTYTIKRSSYEPFIKEFKKTTAQAMDQVGSAGTYRSVKNIEYNDDFSRITITVDKKEYESNKFDAAAGATVGILGAMYQAFDADTKTPSCTVFIIDQESGKELDSATYPKDVE